MDTPATDGQATKQAPVDGHRRRFKILIRFEKHIGDLVAECTADIRKTTDVLGHSDVATTQKHYLSRG